MSNNIELTCPRCKHQWIQSLDVLEKIETFYRGSTEQSGRKVNKYRTQCPKDGTYLIIEVEED